MVIERVLLKRVFGARRKILLAVAVSVLSLSGCEDEGPPPAARRKIKPEVLPKIVAEAAKKAVPDIAFDEAWENLDKDRKLQSYEVRGRNSKGKIRETRISLDGRVLEVE